jgi:hypothetical protein
MSFGNKLAVNVVLSITYTDRVIAYFMPDTVFAGVRKLANCCAAQGTPSRPWIGKLYGINICDLVCSRAGATVSRTLEHIKRNGFPESERLSIDLEKLMHGWILIKTDAVMKNRPTESKYVADTDGYPLTVDEF